MAKTKLSDKISNAITVTTDKGNFDLKAFKKSKNLITNTKFKKQEFIKVSDALQEALGIEGIPMGQITILRGHSDTGKTTALLETIKGCQRQNILPVIIITEMKWSWEHAIQMGLKVEEEIDEETGEILYGGDFIYVDRSSLNSIEDVAAFMNQLMSDQKSGKLPRDLCFLWDSVGSIPSQQSIDSNKNNNEWNAGAMSTQFGNNINQKIMLSRKDGYPYTNTFVIVNKVWVQKPMTYGAMPTLKNSCGDKMFFDCVYQIQFGGVSTSGTSKITATRGGKTVEFAKRTKVQLNKNHIDGITTNGSIIATPHGFIKDTPNAINNYKKEHGDKWLDILGGTDFDVVDDNKEEELVIE